jgi:hypothetical protein
VEDASIGLNCTACPANMETLDIGQKTKDACFAPPGYGYNSTSGDAYKCPKGSYNPGWNRQPCVPCGLGDITSNDEGSTNPDDCITRAGYGTTKADNKTLVTSICPAGSFGRNSDTYGMVTVECTKCPDFSTTDGPGSVNSSQCLTLAGYGYENGGIAICDYGSWSAGHSQNPCTYCGDGYNTSADGVAATQGATSGSQCIVSGGFTPMADGSGLKPCPADTYKALLGNSSCVQCPAGTITTVMQAADAISHCDACRPGFGSASINASAPSCSICGSGYYSPGRVVGGSPCQACPRPVGFTGLMVSRKVGGTKQLRCVTDCLA